MTKRIVIHFEDETGASVCSQFVKRAARIGDVFELNRTTYVIEREKPGKLQHDYYARPEAKPVEYELDGIVHG